MERVCFYAMNIGVHFGSDAGHNCPVEAMGLCHAFGGDVLPLHSIEVEREATLLGDCGIGVHGVLLLFDPTNIRYFGILVYGM